MGCTKIIYDLLPEKLFMGYGEEQLSRTLTFDISQMQAELPGGVPMIAYMRPRDELGYLASGVTLEGSTLTWELSAHVMQYKGIGGAQIVLVDESGEETHILKSHVMQMLIGSSIPLTGGEPPEPWETWLEQILAAAARAESAAADAEAQADRAETAEAGAQQALIDAGSPVLYGRAQTLTDTQQQTARGNIAAASAADVSDLKSALDQVEEPFVLTNLSGNSKIAAESFKAFIVHCEDPNANVKLMRVLKQASNVYAIQFSVNGTNYLALNRSISSYTETAYNSFFINENLYGYYIIDWDAVTAGTAYNNINAVLKQENIQPLDEIRKYGDVKILLPTKIDTVVGREISIEFYNIINCSNVDEFRIDSTPNNAQFQNLHDRLKINTSSAGDTNVTITVYKNDVLITSKVVTVHSVANTLPTIKAIFIGDSMTASGYYLAELKNMMGDNLTLYGTRTSTAEDADGESITINHEGRAGWSTSNYINNVSLLNVPNAFYNNGFDFSYYMTNNPSFNDVTDVFILLGTNDGFGTNIETRIQTITTSIKNYNSNIRVHCMLPPPPIKSGYAFGTRNNLNYLLFKQYMYNIANKYIGIYDGAQGFYVVPVNVNLNCYYDFPQTEVAVNSRNPQLIQVGNDSVHPSKYGYYRFSDIIYADIIANCS